MQPGSSHRAAADASLQALDACAGLGVRAQLLVQPAALGHDRGLLHELLDRARQRDVAVLFDHADADHADAAMACLMDLQERHHRHLGLSLLASRERSADDARLAQAWGLRVRLEHDWPSFDRQHGGTGSERPTRAQVGERFLALAHQLGQRSSTRRMLQVSLITHEPALADQALLALQAGGAAAAIELRADQPKQGVLYVARQRGVAVRSHLSCGVAAPLGTQARNPRTLWWSALQNGLDTLLPAT
jgi:hypothetical protein